jgi:cell division protein FtsB
MKSSLTRFAGAAVLLLLACYAFIALQGTQGIPGLMEKRRLIREYEKKNADKAREIEEQRARISRFGDSPSGELEIEKRLKLVKPGEKVFMLQDAPPTTPPRP